MSKRLVIVLLAALVIVPGAALVCVADDAQADSQQAASDENKDCKCTKCKCENCEDPDCDVENCACDGCTEADCRCTAEACAGRDKADCGSKSGVLTENGKWCPNGCSSCSGIHISGYCCNSAEPSIFGVSGQSLFDGPTSLRTATASDAMWQQIAIELGEPAADTIGAVYAAPVSRSLAQCTQASATIEDKPDAQIQYTIQVIEDHNGCLGEYEELRRGGSMMTAETKTILPAMRMLDRHELIRQLSSPKITCTAGQTAELEIDNGESQKGDGMRLEVVGREFESGLIVELAMHSAEETRNFEVRTAVVIEHGQSIVLNPDTSRGPQDEATEERPAMYIVVTPEIVK